MTDPVIRLDKSKPFSECRGERTPDDPHYRVAYMQGSKVGTKIVLLPFDVNGELVADDRKTEPYPGINSDGKPVQHQPLYNADMRALLERKTKRLADASQAAKETEEVVVDEEIGHEDPADAVNFDSWLRGDVQYQPHELRKAAKARLSKNYPKIYPDLVVDLVLDEKIVPEDQVCPALAKHLPARAAA